jgi:anti-sigma factor RsiW
MSEHIDRVTLEAYVENALPAMQRRGVEVHVTTCPTCQARLANAKQMTALLYELPREMPAPVLAARINAAITAQGAAQRSLAVARWMRLLVLATFVVGLVLLALAAPRWIGWVQAAATAQLPTDQAVLNWLANAAADPVLALDTVMTFVDQTLTGTAEEMDVLLTLATVLLATASLGGLAQLLGGERPRMAAAAVSTSG